MTPSQQKKADDRINTIYCKRCSGVQIGVMDIGKVFAAGRKAIEENPDITDEALGDKVAEFVETIRLN